MATQSACFTDILEMIKDIGETPSCDLDEKLTLSGFETWDHKFLKLAGTDTDVALAIGDRELVAVLIFSHDKPFSLRLKTGEKLLTNLRIFKLVGDDIDDGVYDATTAGGGDDILLTGNGSDTSNIEVFLIHKP